MIHGPSLWGELDPPILDAELHQADGALEELAQRHPDSLSDWHVIQALEALGRRNSASGFAESNPSDTAQVERALEAKRRWGRIALQHIAAAEGEDIPQAGDITHNLASRWFTFSQKYGQTGAAAIKARSERIRELEARIRNRK